MSFSKERTCDLQLSVLDFSTFIGDREFYPTAEKSIWSVKDENLDNIHHRSSFTVTTELKAKWTIWELSQGALPFRVNVSNSCWGPTMTFITKKGQYYMKDRHFGMTLQFKVRTAEFGVVFTSNDVWFCIISIRCNLRSTSFNFTSKRRGKNKKNNQLMFLHALITN